MYSRSSLLLIEPNFDRTDHVKIKGLQDTVLEAYKLHNMTLPYKQPKLTMVVTLHALEDPCTCCTFLFHAPIPFAAVMMEPFN